MKWIRQVRRKQHARRRRFYVFLAIALGIQMLLAFCALALFGSAMAVEIMTVTGSVMIVVFSKFIRPLPFRGRAPEEAAAQVFFEGKDVRSSDNEFEENLKP